MSFPWLREPWLNILQSAEQQRLAHAYYMRHQPQQGTEQFLMTFAQYLLCQQPGKAACGRCKSCLLFKAGNHPDFWSIDASEESKIGIDEVRNLQHKLTQTANQNGARVAVLRPAEKLTEQAANAILKVLEEPPEGMFWLFAVTQPDYLLPTLRSRMQWLPLHLPTDTGSQEADTEQAMSVLNTLTGKALPPVISKKDDALVWLDITETLLLDLLLASQGLQPRLSFNPLAPEYKRLHDFLPDLARKLPRLISDCRQLRETYQHAKGVSLHLLLVNYWQQWQGRIFASHNQQAD